MGASWTMTMTTMMAMMIVTPMAATDILVAAEVSLNVQMMACQPIRRQSPAASHAPIVIVVVVVEVAVVAVGGVR
jgi:hypothetical protein